MEITVWTLQENEKHTTTTTTTLDLNQEEYQVEHLPAKHHHHQVARKTDRQELSEE